jgi:hypothetical protein
VAVTVTGVDALTAVVCTVRTAIERPPGIVTLAGSGRAAELLAAGDCGRPRRGNPETVPHWHQQIRDRPPLKIGRTSVRRILG